MGKLNYFLGLQIKQLTNEIFINQAKYYKELLHRFEMDSSKESATSMSSETYVDKDETDPKESDLRAVKYIMKYLKGTTNIGLWYPKGSICNLVGYANFDYAGCKTDQKITSDTCHILGNALVSWFCKKQTIDVYKFYGSSNSYVTMDFISDASL
uniref:Uncharacterized protein LOC113786242 n=1 Tax=Cicer arietinum TaxID=3827 RepID=A0A3Q7XPY7_CICAR|nr:uncharacterized protein LOC113786242 [Cicer arietinum]